MKHITSLVVAALAVSLLTTASFVQGSPNMPPGLTGPGKSVQPPPPPKADMRLPICRNDITQVRAEIRNLISFNRAMMNQAERARFAKIDADNDKNYKAVQADGLTVDECHAALLKFKQERDEVRKMIATMK